MTVARITFHQLGLILAATSSSAAIAQVVPSGATQTTAAAAANGHIGVTIAMPNLSGISLNQYSAFSVPRAGVDLINTTAQARTIINEVTSNNRSYILGQLAVVGPTAHVILVNPSGITVDGGSFVNTGGVALSTGSISYVRSLTSPGALDTVLTSGNGDILVTGAGLSGSMASLQMLAGRIKIDGPVVNSHPDPQANIEVTAGNASVTLNSSILPGTTLKPWATHTDNGGSSKDILIDVTPNGSLSASRIHMAVGARGAGVSFAGHGQASIGEFTISANGAVSIPGGSVQAEKAVKIVAGRIDVLNTPAAQSQVTSISGGVTLLANISDINVTGEVRGVTRDKSDPDSKGGVTLSATGNISLLSENASRLAIVFSATDDLYATAGKSISNETGRILANGRVFINAAADLRNSSGAGTGAANGGAPVYIRKTGSRFWWWPFGGHSHTTTLLWNAGDLRVAGNLAYIAGSSVFINAANVDNSGEIDAMTGALRVDTGRLVNNGAATGLAYFSRYCALTCSAKGFANISLTGGRINAAGSMQLNASTWIVNNGGVIASYDNMAINSPSIVASATYAPAVSDMPGGLYNGFSGHSAFLSLQPIGGQFITPVGGISITTDNPVQIDGGALSAATSVDNPAGVRSRPAPPAFGAASDVHIGVFRGFW